MQTLRVNPSFICVTEKIKAAQPCAPPLDGVLCWLHRAQGGPDLAKQVTRSLEPQLPRCFRHRTPPHPPRPSASPTQVTPPLGPPRPPSPGASSPLEKRSRTSRAGTAPGGHWLSQNKSRLPHAPPGGRVPRRGHWVPENQPEQLWDARSTGGSRVARTAPTPGGVPPADHGARGRSYRAAEGRAGRKAAVRRDPGDPGARGPAGRG